MKLYIFREKKNVSDFFSVALIQFHIDYADVGERVNLSNRSNLTNGLNSVSDMSIEHTEKFHKKSELEAITMNYIGTSCLAAFSIRI